MTRRSKPLAEVQASGDKTIARRIATARAAFNAAIARRDYQAISEVLCEDCALVPGDDAQLLVGRDMQLEAWQSIVRQAPDAIYVRTPSRIDVSDDHLLAAETGRWKGGWSSDGFQVHYTGRYFAKWRLEGDDWKIASEIFVTLKRTGSAAH